ncbi:hypothetical protein CCP3SC15_1550011 [Gammaproteobacteria bacterium]
MITAKEIKEAGITRLDLAHELKIPYPSLCNKMQGYTAWVGDELDRAAHILAAAKAKRGDGVTVAHGDHCHECPPEQAGKNGKAA